MAFDISTQHEFTLNIPWIYIKCTLNIPCRSWTGGLAGMPWGELMWVGPNDTAPQDHSHRDTETMTMKIVMMHFYRGCVQSVCVGLCQNLPLECFLQMVGRVQLPAGREPPSWSVSPGQAAACAGAPSRTGQSHHLRIFIYTLHISLWLNWYFPLSEPASRL